MDLSTIKIINGTFDFLGDIDDYISFYFVRNFTSAKEFQIVAPVKYLDVLKNDNIIFTTPKKAGIIEEVAIDEDKKVITAKGRDLKSVVGRRITVPPIGKTYDEIKAPAEEVIKYYVTNNCTAPLDPNRRIEQLEIATDKKRGPILAWQSRFKYLDFELEQICNVAGIGWEVYLDLDRKKFIFDVVEGVDRTKDADSRVIFSEEFDNITASIHTNNSLSYKTMGYVAGQGEGEDRTVQEVFKTADTGMARRELFIDARDIEKEDNLPDRAKAKLAEYDHITSNESTVINSNFEYEKDWNLGDVVILKNSLGESFQRVAEVTEAYEGYRKIDIVLGSVIPMPSEKISIEVSSMPNSDGSSKMWRPSIDSNGNLAWTLNSSLEIPGTQSIKGPKGDKGDTGATGSQGIQGIGLNFVWNGTQLGMKREDEVSYKYVELKGQKGDAGVQGLPGIGLQFTWDGTRLGIKKETDSSFIYVDLKGATGERGPQGLQGVPGVKGDTGAQGSQGLQGIQGPKGDTGAQGIQGIQGNKGDKIKHQWNSTILKLENPDGTFDIGVDLKGEKGDKGDQGPQGIQGVQGPSGNGQSYVVFQKYFIASEGQKIFSWTDGFMYPIGINAIAVYINGVRVGNKAFKESSGSSIEFYNALSNGDSIFIEAMQAVTDLQGPPGPKGDTGSQGAQGIQGIPGIPGKNLEFLWNGTQLGVRQQGQAAYTFVNLQGQQGVQGIKGDTGAIGPKGDTGLTGATGPKGDTWRPTVDSTGNVSWTLNNGATAPTAVNIKGPKGDTGAQGATGATGSKGDTGATGAKGNDGITPTIGANGNWFLGSSDTGKPSRGAQGAQGIQGVQGLKGDKGDTGATGAQGIKGDQGAQGPQGLPGKDGTQIITSSTQPTGVPKGTVWI